ncbi:protein IQ-DOMAIN 33 [Typha angustifolia]|uniref:protein IQ-DOMAIN 33 n=1 Tax=Typha angustifolia TaxID=59011 RepID=UPI003C2F0373
MGLAGGLVKRVLSKSRSSVSSRAGDERSCLDKKSRWSSVRLYLCGDEFNAVEGENDMVSIKSSEATTVQPVVETPYDEESSSVTKSEEVEQLILKEEQSSKKFLSQEDAAIFIQSAFRSFMARHRYYKIRRSSERDHTEGLVSPPAAAASMASSTEVQIGESFDTLTLSEASVVMQHQMHQKARPQVFRVKEDWDDSTLSCNVSKLRIQNRLEATTRRERALAYAFSQQLRTCNTKKRSTESNVGWSWLERWMATRLPENSTMDDCLSKHFDLIPTARRSIVIKKRSDVAAEEKESCGSNDVSVSFDSSKTPSQTPRSGHRSTRSRLKATKNVSRQRTVSDYRSAARPNKVSKKEHKREVEKEKEHYKQEEQKNQVKIEGCDIVCQPPSEC